MPNNQNRSNQDFSKFDSMTTEELEEILRSDAQKTEGEELDLEMLLYVMEVLAARRKNSENPGKTAAEAFETFKEHYMPDDSTDDAEQVSLKPQVINMKPTMRLRPWLSRLAVTAAILAFVLVSSVTAHAMGIDILDIVVKWTQETFHFGDPYQNNLTEPATDDCRSFLSLEEALESKGIPDGPLPMWIPEGYSISDIQVDTTPLQMTFLALYNNSDQLLKIQIQYYLAEDPQQIEQSDDLIEIYESAGIEYYIFSNYDMLKAAWINKNYECYISGPITIDELKTMLDSIQ